MADNTTLNTGTGGDVIASDDIGGVKHQRVKVGHGADGSATDTSAAAPFPVGFPGNTAAEILTTATLLAAAVYTSAEIDGSVYPFVRVSCFADQQGTLVLEASVTSAGTYRTEASFDVRASSKRVVTFEPSARYYRLKYTNGAAANTVFELQISPKQTGHHDLAMVTLQRGCGFQDTTTIALGIAGAYTAPSADTSNQGQLLTVVVKADQDGTLYIEESHNNSTWQTLYTYVILAGILYDKQHSSKLRYVRNRYLNGGVSQVTWFMQSMCRTISVVDSVRINSESNIVKGGISEGTLPVALDGLDVFPAIVADSARTLTDGRLSRVSVKSDGDLKVTLDSEIQISGGDTSHGAADSGNPVKIGGVARTTDPVVVANGNRVNSYFDITGRQVIIANAPRGRRIRAPITLTTTTETTLLAAAAATFHDLTKVLISNTSATAVRVDFRDTTAGSIAFSIYAPAGQTVGFTDSNDPIEQATLNTNWTAQLSAAVTDVRIFAQAVKKVA